MIMNVLQREKNHTSTSRMYVMKLPLNADFQYPLACRAGEIFSSERSHRKKFSRHLEFFMQWKTGERKKVLPRG